MLTKQKIEQSYPRTERNGHDVWRMSIPFPASDVPHGLRHDGREELIDVRLLARGTAAAASDADDEASEYCAPC